MRGTPHWRVRVAVGEGWRNFAAGRVGSVVAVALVVLLAGGVALADSLSVGRLLDREQQWVESGGRLLVLSSEGGVSAAACERLNRVPGVRAAGAVQQAGNPAGLATAPDAHLRVMLMTAGLPRVLGVADAAGDLLVSRPVYDGLRLELGAPVQLRGDRVQPASAGSRSGPLVPSVLPPSSVGAVAATEVLGDAYGSAVFLPVAATGGAEACFVQADAGSVEPLRVALPGLVRPVTGTAPTVVADRLISGRFGTDYSASYRDRALRQAPWLAGLVLGLTWLLIRWGKRSQDGLLSTLGADALTRMLIRLTEWSCVLGMGLVLSVFVAVPLGIVLEVPLDALGWHLGRALLIAAGVSNALAVLTALIPLRSPLAALKDR